MTRPQTNGYAQDGQLAATPLADVSITRVRNSRRTTAGGDEFCDATGHLIAYARCSTAEQDLALQLDALERAGAEKVFQEHGSGAKADRPELARCLEYLREGDTLVIYSLSRLARSIRHLLEIAEDLEHRGIQLRSLTEQLDTSSPTGRFTFAVLAAVGQLERDLIRERTNAGLAAARARGRVGGRPTVMTAEKTRAARQLYDAGHHNVSEIAKTLGVSRASVYRSLAAGG